MTEVVPAGMSPAIADILAALRQNRIPEWHTLGPVRAREVYGQRVDIFAGEKTPVGEVRDVTIEGPATPLRLRLYSPLAERAGEGPWPVLVYLHGGGWMLGGLESHDDLCRRLAVAVGALVVGIEYRLAPEHPFPAPFEDCLAGVRWAADHAAEHGGDPARLAVAGDSAGGNMSAALGIYARDHGGPDIAACVLVYPALIAEFEKLSFYENAHGKLLSRADTIWFWHNYLGPNRHGDPYAEPGASTDLRELPPLLVITAGFDPLRDDGEVFAHRVREAGSPVLLKRYPGMIHGFIGLPVELEEKDDAIELIARNLHRVWRGLAMEEAP